MSYFMLIHKISHDVLVQYTIIFTRDENTLTNFNNLLPDFNMLNMTYQNITGTVQTSGFIMTS